MGKPDPEDDWIVIESFARWAGDTTFERESLLKGTNVRRIAMARTRKENFDSVPTALIKWAEVRLEKSKNEKPSRQETAHRELVKKPETIEQSEVARRPSSPILQGRTIRAVASVVNPREFELRAYPTRLDEVPLILERAAIAERKFAKAGTVERERSKPSQSAQSTPLDDEGNPLRLIKAKGASWTMPGRVLRFVWVDAFGLIFARATWTPEVGTAEVSEVFDSFREILRLLDGK